MVDLQKSVKSLDGSEKTYFTDDPGQTTPARATALALLTQSSSANNICSVLLC